MIARVTTRAGLGLPGSARMLFQRDRVDDGPHAAYRTGQPSGFRVHEVDQPVEVANCIGR